MSDIRAASIPSLSATQEKNKSLSERINAATRTTHHHLNKLIIARLPLALPPFVTDPSIYASGLLRVAPIYIKFEALWSQIIENTHGSTVPGSNNFFGSSATEQLFQDSRGTPQISNEYSPVVCYRIHSLLHYLQLPDLLRSKRLQSDIQNLTNASASEIQTHIDTASITGSLAKFLKHSKRSIEKNPHVILAYAWVLYMALFSGGRYVRSSLKDAGGSGASFWDQDASLVSFNVNNEYQNNPKKYSSASTDSGGIWTPKFSISQTEEAFAKMNSSLQFFHFEGDKDGEDIKAEFKKRFNEAEDLLTSSEKIEIVLESQQIFNYMIKMVEDLDEILDTQENDIEITRLMQESRFIMRVRDSISVAKQRLYEKNIAKEADLVHGIGIVRLWETLLSFLQSIRATSETSAPKGKLPKIRFPSTLSEKRLLYRTQLPSGLLYAGVVVCFFVWCWFGGNLDQVAQILG